MPKADSVHSTPPTNTSLTRRNMIGAIATITAATALATAAPADAAPAVDPIYAAIEAHRKAAAAAEVAFAESNRLHRLADEIVGTNQIEVPNMAEPGTTAKASCWWDIDRVIPSEKYPDLNERYCKLLDDRRAAREEIHGDTDELTDAPANAAWDARDQFAETVPTTLPGLLAMIVYANELADEDPDAFTGDGDCPLLQTLATAAKALIGRPA